MSGNKCCIPRRVWFAAWDIFRKSSKLFRLWLLHFSKPFRLSACRACNHQAVENYQPPPAFDAPGSGSFPPPAVSRIPKYFRRLRGRPAQGYPAQNFGQHAQREKAEGTSPSEKPVLTLTLLDAEELSDLRFAVYCHIGEVQDSDEADHPEVVPHIERLNAILGRLIALEKGAQS